MTNEPEPPYTPTTGDVRNRYAKGYCAGAYDETFDRWLAAHDAEKIAEGAAAQAKKDAALARSLYPRPLSKRAAPGWDEYYAADTISTAILQRASVLTEKGED